MESHKGIWIPLAFIALASIACSVPLIDQLFGPTPSPTSELEIVILTPSPTQTPLPPLPPTLIESQPARGEELHPNESITLYFDQSMDSASVEAALKIDPVIQGDLIWQDESTLEFDPSQPLGLDTKYVFRIEEQAKSSIGLKLSAAIELALSTPGYLEVTQVNPEPGISDVDPATSITVVFNRPVVPLQVDAETPQPLTFDPPISGHGEWVDTSIYLFRPEEPLPGGSEIHLSLQAGLEDVGGGVLAEGYEWSFFTSTPGVIELDPVPDDNDVLLDHKVKITFNQSMDTARTQGAFSLTSDDGIPVRGTFEWSEESRVLIFVPSQLLEYDQRYDLLITNQAQNSSGTPLSSELLSTFNTIQRPGVVSTSPRQGGIKTVNRLLSISFSSPMDEASLVEAISISPEVESFGGFWRSESKEWAIHGDFEPATSYLLRLDNTATDLMETPIAEPFLLRFSTSDMPPHLGFVRYNEILTLTTLRPPQVEMQVRNLSRLDLRLYRLSLDEFFSLLRSSSYSYPEPTIAGELLQEWSQPVDSPENVTQILKVPLQPDTLASGAYMLIVESPDDPDDAIVRLLVVRDVELVVKSTLDHALVWAVELSRGQPISDQPIRIYANDGVELSRGQTNNDGILELDFPQLDDPYDRIFAVTGSPGEAGFGFTASTWADGIGSYEFGIWLHPHLKNVRIYLYTDRPIYRPGQTVHFKGVIRDIQGDQYLLPEDTTISVSLQDWNGETISNQIATVSTYGTFQGQFKLNQEAGLGEYQIQTEEGSVYFTVAAYRKPEFIVTVSPSAEDVAAGDPLPAEIETEFFFGGPVSGAEVRWNAYASPTFPTRVPQPINWFDRARFSYPYYSFNSIANGEGITDDQGKLSIELPTTLEEDLPLQVTVDVTVTDSSGLSVTESGSFNLHPATLYLSLDPDRYTIRENETAVVRLGTFDWDGNLLPEQLVQIDVERVIWSQTVSPEGRIIYESKSTLVNQAVLKTTSDGTVLFSFEPQQAGTYKVRATATDPSRRETEAELTIWVSGEGSRIWRQPSAERIVLVPDREEYSPGDTAHILVPSPFDGPVNALITVERRGVISHQTITISGSDTTLEIPIETPHIPNIFVSVVLIQPASLEKPEAIAVGLVELDINAESKKLNVELTHDPMTAEPGGTIQYNLKVSDSQGNPVQAEFSFALVDLAVLSLTDPNSTSPFGAFYSSQPLSVRTGASISLKAEGLTPLSQPEGVGGGGGEPLTLEVRSEFPDTAYWAPSVVTDAEGNAQISLTLPDSLTTWRLDIRGVTNETLTGSATLDVISTKALLIRPITPRFFTAGDAATVAAIVHNNTQEDLSAEVRLIASGTEIIDPTTQWINISSGDHERVEWSLIVQNVDGVDLTFIVSGGGLEDASKPTIGTAEDGILPVIRYSAPDTAATAGHIEGEDILIEAVNLPRRFSADQGDLTISLDPSFGAAVNTALTVLEHSPYVSTEQLISRFMPNLVTYRTLQELGIGDPTLEARLERTLEESLQTLYTRQNDDGGWGWWRQGSSDPYITAYSLFALVQARDAGVSVNEFVFDPAIQFLRAGIVPPSLAMQSGFLNQQSFLLYVLAQAGEGDLATTMQMVSFHENLSLSARALLVSTLSILSPNTSELPSLISDLESNAIRSATGTHWQDEDIDFRNLDSGVKTTAHVLNALLSVDETSSTIQGAVRWLLASRAKDSSWNSTHETTWAILSLVEWLKVSGVLESNYDYKIKLNGQILASGTTSQEAILSSLELVTPIQDLLANQPNQVSIERSAGTGSLFYTAHLTVYRPVEDVTPTSRGLSVHREYFMYDGTCGGVETPCTLASTAHVGDDLLVRITLIVPTDQYYISIEDPFPAGMEPIETRLTISPLDQLVLGESTVSDNLRPWGWWYFSHVELDDDRLKVYADYLPAGTYHYTYQLHALLPGEYRILPIRVWATYFPEVYGQGAGRVYSIQP